MSSPLDPQFAQRLRNAGGAVGGSNPSLALGLAQSDLDDEQVQLVGGFTQALDTATLARMARYSGARLNLTPTQRSQMDAIGEPYDDVDDSKLTAGDSRNWLEKAFDTGATALSNTGSAVVDALDPVFDTFDWLSSGAKLPARMLSDAFDGENDDEIDQQMLARGYDPDSAASYFAFMWNQGDSLYHDLDAVRQTYGDDAVDLAIEAQRDPEGFQSRLPKLSAEQQALTQTPEFEKAYDAVDRQHISPGRDVARLILPESAENGAAFTAISGTLDAAYTILLDPTLMLGKVSAAARGIDAMGDLGRLSRVQRATGVGLLAKGVDATTRGYFRQGLENATDAEGIRRLLTGDTAVRKGAERFLNDAKALREATDPAERASIYAGMRARNRALMPLLDEVNGGRVIRESSDGVVDDVQFDRKLTDVNGTQWLARNGKAIETVEDFADYMASTAGLVRLAGGVAAKRQVFLPGKVNARTRLMGYLAERRTAKGVARNDERLVYDHSRPNSILPDEADDELNEALDEVERMGDTAEAAARGDAIYEQLRRGTNDVEQVDGKFKGGFRPLKVARARAEQMNRRLTSLLPKTSQLNFADASGTDTVRAVARLYMNKAESDRIASLYAVANEAQRRQIGTGLVEQMMHASGLSRSEAGQEFIRKYRADAENMQKRAYGLNGTDVITTEAGERHVALYPSQISDSLTLPSFKAMQYAATKYVVGGRMAKAGGYIRAGFIGDRMDTVLRPITMGWLVSAAGGTRNALDELAGGVLRGEAGETARARAALSAARKTSKRQARVDRKAALAVEGRLLPQIPAKLRAVGDTVDDVLVAQGLGRLMRMGRDNWDETDARYVGHFVNDLEANLLDEGLNGTYHNADQFVKGNDDALEMHRAGLMATQVRFDGTKVQEFDGWKQVEADGGKGYNAWANGLAQRFADPSSPAHVALDAMLKGEDALGWVMEYMRSPAMRHFRERAEVMNTLKDGTPIRKGNALDEDAVLEEYAQRMIADVKYAVTGRDGVINGELADKLLSAEVVDVNWLKANVLEEELPEHVIDKVFLPVNPKHLPGQLAAGYTEMMTRAYDQVVTKQVNALSRNPMQLAAYVQARRNMEGYYTHLLDEGFNEDAAEAVVHRMARGQADALVYKSVDDPQTATQFSILARNWWAFERAQEDWLRRWGRQLRDDPTQIRKLQLAVHGGTSAGILEQNDQGDLTFVYPGSGALINAFQKLGAMVGIGSMVDVPMMPDLRSQLTFVNPSLDNPLGFSSTPVISLPLKAMTSLMGSEYPILASAADKIVNGELGAGREWYETLAPAFVGRIVNGMSEEADSQFGSAFTSALANLDAAGYLDDPELALDPSKRQEFLDTLKTQVHNQMIARSVMGFFLPASPSTPTNDVQREDGTWVMEPDFTAQKAGLASLKDEARKLFSEMPYEDAMAFWTEHHPKESMLAPTGSSSRTQVGTKSAQAPATLAAAAWMQDQGKYVLDKYGKGEDAVGIYFMPPGKAGTPDGEFSDVAYRAQLERGIREYKDLDDYFEQIIVANGEAVYYDTKDDYDDEIARAQAAGNSTRVDQLEQAWAEEKAAIYRGNPLLEQKNALYATNPARQRMVIQQLNTLLADPEAVAGIGADAAAGTAQLLLARRAYDAAIEGVKGERGFSATAARSDAARTYQNALAQIGGDHPDLADLIRGAFRIPD